MSALTDMEDVILRQKRIMTEVAAELRHAYKNLVNSNVTLSRSREFADGLLAPSIRKLEKATRP